MMLLINQTRSTIPYTPSSPPKHPRLPWHQTHLQPRRFRQCACVPSLAAAPAHGTIPHTAPYAGVTPQQLTHALAHRTNDGRRAAVRPRPNSWVLRPAYSLVVVLVKTMDKPHLAIPDNHLAPCGRPAGSAHSRITLGALDVLVTVEAFL